jgi:site-specific DNA-cytosine methylase
VPRLTHHRHVDPDYQTGAEALLQYLDQQGYQADWTTASADDYGLPQSRCRVYIVAVRAMPPLHCKHAARKKVSAA